MMSYCEIVTQKLENFFGKQTIVSVPLQASGRRFEARIIHDGDRNGFIVNNLGNLGYLPFEVFCVTVKFLLENDGKAKKGNALKARLGEPELPFNSVEGWVAHKVYGKRKGETIFRRISPINGILLAAGLCQQTKLGFMQLNEAFETTLQIYRDNN